MNTVVARVLRVLQGHSPTAMIHAVDNNHNELKLEVPVESTRNITVGQLLVLQWSVHDLPGTRAAAVEVVPLVEPTATAEPRVTTASGVIESTPPEADAASRIEALLGLRPGRLRGAGPSELP